MSSIDCSETALSNEGGVWRFLILRVVRGVLDLAIPEATIRLVAFDVFISCISSLKELALEFHLIVSSSQHPALLEQNLETEN